MTSFGGLFGLFFFFLRTSEMSLLPVACPVDVFLTFISQCLSFIPPFFSHSRVSRSFLIHRQHPTPCPWLLPLFPSLCLSGKLCLPCQSPCRLVLCGFCADSGVGFEGKAQYLICSRSPQYSVHSRNRLTIANPHLQLQPPIRLTIGIVLQVSMENAVCRCSLGPLYSGDLPNCLNFTEEAKKNHSLEFSCGILYSML